MTDDSNALRLRGTRREGTENVEREPPFHGLILTFLHHTVHATSETNIETLVREHSIVLK